MDWISGNSKSHSVPSRLFLIWKIKVTHAIVLSAYYVACILFYNITFFPISQMGSWISSNCPLKPASQAAQVRKNPPANAGDIRDPGSIPGPGRFPGRGNNNPLQYPCPENPMDKGAWWATVHGVTQSQTWLKWLSMHTCPWKHN